MDLNAPPLLIMQVPTQFAIVSQADIGGLTVYS